MADLSIPYTLVGPDGTRVVFNDPTDPDFVGLLEEVTGLDGPETRESSEDRADGDGGSHGDFWHGRRPVTLAGIVWPDPHETRIEREDRIQQATNAMRADAILSWTPTGQSARRLLLRRAQPPRITGKRPKNVLIAMVAEDAFMASPSVNSIQIVAGGSVSSGLPFPWAFPLTFQSVTGPSGSTFIVNQGNASAPPIFRVTGPITNPRIRNETTGKEIRVVYDLDSDDHMDLDVDKATIVLNGNTNRYGALDFAASEWWTLEPGSNDVRLFSSAEGAGASLTVSWRDAWV